MSTSRVPQTIPAFNAYINSTDDYQLIVDPVTLIPNFQRLGLTAVESGNWTTKRVYWRDTLYPKYTNALTSSSIVKKDVKDYMKAFRVFANPLLNRMAASTEVNNTDEGVFKFVAVRDTERTERGAIDVMPYPLLKSIGGGMVQVKARTFSDATRASRHPLADGLEIKYAVIGTDTVSTPPSPGTPSGGTPTPATPTPPATQDNCTSYFFSKKAFLKLELGTASDGKMLYAFFRWVNLSKPANNGPWSGRFQIRIA